MIFKIAGGHQKMAAVRTPVTPGLKRSASKGALKRAVTFKAGLLTDHDWQSYDGPLLTMDQVLSSVSIVTTKTFRQICLGTHDFRVK